MTARPKPRRTSVFNLPSAFELFKPSRDLIIKNLHVFGPLYILPFLYLASSWLWNIHATHGGQYWHLQFESRTAGITSPTIPLYSSYLVGFSLLALVGLVLAIIVQIMLPKAQLDAAEDRAPSLQRGWATVKELGWRLVGLYVVVGLIVLVGFILLIVPGVIMLRRYYLAQYVMMDKKCGIKEAMDTSAAMTKPYSYWVLTVIGVMFLISLVSIVPIVGSLVSFGLAALYSVAPALRYQQLKKLAE